MTNTTQAVQATKATKAVPAKPRAKAAPKKATASKAAQGVAFALVDRPSSGNRLYAFTQAVQELYGMDKGKGVQRATFAKVVGATAINYHKNKGTYAISEDGTVTITAAGKASFASRAGRIDRDLVDAFKSVMSTGKPHDAVCKNADMIKAV